MKIVDPEFTVETIVRRMKDAVARSASLAGVDSWLAADDPALSGEIRATDEPFAVGGSLDIQPIDLRPPFRPATDGRYHVNDLLKYHDRNFLQNAYLAILKRGPDASGSEGFLDALRSGRLNKIDVLARLRFSREGREKNVQIKGLIVPAAMRMSYRLPIIGYLLNLLVGVLRLPVMIRSQRQFESQMFAQQEILVENINHLGLTLKSQAREAAHAFTSQRQTLDRLREEFHRQIERLKGELEGLKGELERLKGDHASRHEMLLDRIGELTNYLEDRVNDEALQRQQTDERLTVEVSRTQQELGRRQQEFGERLAATNSQVQEVQAEHLEFAQAQLERTDTLDRRVDVFSKQGMSRIEHVFQKYQQLTAELVLQGERLTRLLEEAGKRLPEPFDQNQLQAIAGEEPHLLDAFYAAFDEQFRGSREAIKERLKIYLPFIKDNGLGTKATPILDLGCGRGEWLELLKEENLRALGVDSNRVLVPQCRALGLEVVEDDLMNYLRGVADESLGAITGFHIVEHLPIEILVKVFDETVRALRPGGIVLFETPNPENVLVGSCNFYFDPSHRNPLPSPIMRFLIESRGYKRVEIINVNPSDATRVEGETDLVQRFNDYFYGPMDYAVVGWKA